MISPTVSSAVGKIVERNFASPRNDTIAIPRFFASSLSIWLRPVVEVPMTFKFGSVSSTFFEIFIPSFTTRIVARSKSAGFRRASSHITTGPSFLSVTIAFREYPLGSARIVRCIFLSYTLLWNEAMKQPTFSILIPTSGRADLIAMAVKSILDQTFRDFEIVIADLSGTEEVRSFEKSDSRIRYVFAPEGGLTTWDVAAKHAEGKYILWLDDDNYLLPFALDLFKRTIDRTHADIVSATHLYYYDRAHPRHYLRNNIGVVPFTGATHSLDPKKALEGIYAFARRGTGAPLPRFHFSATAVSGQ